MPRRRVVLPLLLAATVIVTASGVGTGAFGSVGAYLTGRAGAPPAGAPPGRVRRG